MLGGAGHDEPSGARGQDWDAVVVGAGPVVRMVAIELARQGRGLAGRSQLFPAIKSVAVA